MYALKTKGKLEFSRAFKTTGELDIFIGKAFQTWRGIQARGSNKTIEDFMEDKEKVRLTIERI